jgi:hypothetical protein
MNPGGIFAIQGRPTIWIVRTVCNLASREFPWSRGQSSGDGRDFEYTSGLNHTLESARKLPLAWKPNATSIHIPGITVCK